MCGHMANYNQKQGEHGQPLVDSAVCGTAQLVRKGPRGKTPITQAWRQLNASKVLCYQCPKAFEFGSFIKLPPFLGRPLDQNTRRNNQHEWKKILHYHANLLSVR